jgi:hypothetical protein
MKSIRELRAQQAQALERYHAEYRALEEQIQSIRKERGTVLKVKPFEPYFEPGRSQEPGPR